MPEQLTCTRKGCQKQYSESENHQEACTFHSGAPIFHEGLKGWSCCEKRTVDFDEFMKIPGCCLGPHSSEKEDKPEPGKKEASTSKDAPTLKSTDVTSKTETYSTQPAIVSPLPTTPRGTTPTIKEPEPEVILEDPENLKVDVGTPCKRQSCKHAYVSDEVSRKGGSDAECTYHSGKPVFHEGSKGWSCCKRKVLEFDEFLKIKGCKKGNHLFGEQLSIVDCRKDWYQTSTQVILSIFAKNTEKESCKISFTSHAIIVDLKFQNGKSLYQKTIDLFQEITPEESSYKVMSTKVELTLKKANGISWPSLEPTDGPITSWTTFGRGDSPLTM